MTVSDLHDRIVTSLVKAHGGTKRRWRMALGSVRVHDRRTHPHCNWSVSPSGNPSENEAIERLLDDLRVAEPLIEQD